METETLILWKHGREANERGDAAQALACYTAALLASPSDIDLLLGKGSALLLLSRYAEAATVFQEAIRLAPQNSGGYAGRGAARLRLGQYELAILDREEQIRLTSGINDDLPDAYADLAHAHTYFGRYEQAAEYWGRVQEVDPVYPHLDWHLGHSAYRRKDYRAALEHYQRASIAEPDDPDILYSIGISALKVGDNELAQASLKQALALRPDWALALEPLASAERALGNDETAFLAWLAALRLTDPERYKQAREEMNQSLYGPHLQNGIQSRWRFKRPD